MSGWKLLGIEPTNDVKVIKKAYAVLLKLNKPDENPEGFAQLHKAYKGCCTQAKNMARAPIAQPSNQPLNQSVIVNSEAASEPTSRTIPVEEQSKGLTLDKPFLPEEDGSPELNKQQSYTINSPLPDDKPAQAVEPESALVIDTPFQEEIVPDAALDRAEEDLKALTAQALESMMSKDDPNDWRFIEQCDALYDISFKQGYSQYLIEQVLRFFEGSKVLPKKRSTSLFYLNSQFDWLNQARDFEEQWGYPAIAPVFDVLHVSEGIQERKLKWFVDKRHNGPIEDANYYARLCATSFDLVAFFMAANLLLPALETAELIVFATLAFLFVKGVLESSPMQGSPGQVLFGLKVTTKKGRRLNVFHSLWRQLMYGVTMAGFKVTVWINFFLNGRLLHDRLSQSIVIKR